MPADPPLPFQLLAADLEVRTDISDSFLAKFCPVVRSAFQQMIFLLPLHQPVKEKDQPLRIWVLRADDTFRAFTRARGEEKKGSFVGGRGTAYVRGDPNSLYETRRRTLHEVGHILHRRCNMEILPDRFKQGFVDLLSLHTWDGAMAQVGTIRGAGEPRSADIATFLSTQGAALDFVPALTDPKADISLGSAVADFILRHPHTHPFFVKYLEALRAKPKDYANAYAVSFRPNEAALRQAFIAHCQQLLAEHRAAPTPEDVNCPVDAV